MKNNSKPAKGNKTTGNNNKSAETAVTKTAAAVPPAVQANPAEKPATDKSDKPAKPAKAPKAASGKAKLQIITTDFSGKTEWANRFGLAIRGEGEQFLPGWYVTHYPTKEAREAEIALLSEGIDKVETRANKPVTLNGKQVFFLRWKGGHREAQS
jgi:hypothetical protein